MTKLLLFILPLLVFFVLAHREGDEATPGVETSLTEDELKSKEIKKKFEKAVKKINIHKQNTLPACVEYEGTLNSGTHQIVSGDLYRFYIHIQPKVSDSVNCQGVYADVDSVKPEECEVRVWEKVCVNFEEYTVNC